MKFLAAGFALLLTSTVAQAQVRIYDPTADAASDIAQAQATAAKAHKRVLIDFGGNWCPDCLALVRLMAAPEVKAYLDEHFVVVRVDVGRMDNNLDLVKKYGNPIAKGVPAIVILDAGGHFIASTKNGEVESARHMVAEEVLALLKGWSAG